jgi:large subunit ribosomal protein L22
MAQRIESGAQEAVAAARYIRTSPTKARQVVDLIRGRHVDDARRVLRFSERSVSATVAKVLESAIANAEHNHSLPTDELVVARAWVDEGPTLRRFRPRALGRATRIRKRTCHISIVVGRRLEVPLVLREAISGLSRGRSPDPPVPPRPASSRRHQPHRHRADS